MAASFSDREFQHPNLPRSVPIRQYDPIGEILGWVLFSVGYGGNRDGYAFLARKWQELGLAVVVTEHVGSNLNVLKSFAQRRREERNQEVVRRVQEPAELRARAHDIRLVYDELAASFYGLPLGLGGHSYGSYSALAAVGLEPRSTKHGLKPIPADSLLLISPQPPGYIFDAADYQKVNCPTLVMTGTKDHLLDGNGDYQERKKVYDSLPSEMRNLLLLSDLEHMTFAGIGLGVEKQLQLVSESTSAWWSGHLLNNDTKSDWTEIVKSANIDQSMVAECR